MEKVKAFFCSLKVYLLIIPLVLFGGGMVLGGIGFNKASCIAFLAGGTVSLLLLLIGGNYEGELEKDC